MTWRGVEDPNDNLDELIEGYFADQKLLAASTARLLREHRPISKTPLPGYDGRLFDWLVETLMLDDRRRDGPERAWPIILRLIERAPDDEALAFVGSGALEDLVNGAGAAFADRILDEAARSRSFRASLRHVWPDTGVPESIRAVIRSSRAAEAE